MLLSGGIDSATCLYLANRRGYILRALTILFHAIAEGEVSAAKRLARRARVREHRLVEIPELKELGDIRSNPGSEATLGGLPRTYIPLRNLIFYGLAASYAEEVGANCIIGGHNKDDLALFEDTGSEFFANLQKTVWSASTRLRERRLGILRPLQRMTKTRVVSLAANIGVPLELTWSCYEEGVKHCWRCDGCIKRIDAFRKAGVTDPLRRAGVVSNKRLK